MFIEASTWPTVTTWSVTEPGFTPSLLDAIFIPVYKMHTFRIKKIKILKNTFNKRCGKLIY